jgi:hypothetical protein
VNPDCGGDRHPGAEGPSPRRELVADKLRLLDGHRIGGASGDRRWSWRPHPLLDQREAGGARQKSASEHQPEAERLGEAPLALAQLLEALLDDLDPVHEDLGEEEGQDTDREHRQRHAGALRNELDPSEGQP